MFFVWTDIGNREFKAFERLGDAVDYALDGNHLITENIPIGDERLLLVEDLAQGDLEPYGATGYHIIKNIRDAARKAVRRSRKNDPFRVREYATPPSDSSLPEGPTEDDWSVSTRDDVSEMPW